MVLGKLICSVFQHQVERCSVLLLAKTMSHMEVQKRNTALTM